MRAVDEQSLAAGRIFLRTSGATGVFCGCLWDMMGASFDKEIP